MWNGMLSFGLVNIPVGLYAATDDQDLQFHFPHAKDHGRVQNQRVCSVDNEPVEYKDLIKGYEYEKGKYVELTEEDLESVRVEASDRIVIEDFVAATEIDAKYFEKPYYLLPGKKSDAPYGLLRVAMTRSDKVGIARIVIRTKERLAAVRVDGPMLMLDTMHFDDEIRKIDPPATTPIGKREIHMATTLINAMTTSFDPNKYRDTYREAVLDMIDKKIEGKEVVHDEVRLEPTQIVDLMAHIKKSLEQATARNKPAPTRSSRKKSNAA